MRTHTGASRRRFAEYLAELKRRRATGEFRSRADSDDKPPTGPRHRSFGQLLGLFWELLGVNRPAVVAALWVLAVSTVLKLVPPAATKIAIDYALADQPLPANILNRLPALADSWMLLLALAGAVVVISIVESTIGLWGRWQATRAVKRVQADVRRRVFEHAVRLPLHRVYDLKSGGAASLLREDAGGIADLIFSMLYNPFRAIVQLVGSLIILAWVDWKLLLGSFVLLPTIYFTHRTWISRIRPFYRDIRRQRQRIDAHATEAFGGMRVVRAFSRQRSETGRFLTGTHLMARQELNAWWWARAVEMVWEVLLPLASAGLLLYGGWRVLEDNLTIGDLMMFLAYLAMLLGPLAVLATSATSFQNNLAGFDRVLDLFAEPREIPAVEGALTVDRENVAGAVEVDRLSFRYPGTTEDVLSDINFKVEAGQTIALVGPSGAGKTTLCNLIARFYDPTEGAIRLDGVDLRSLEVESYRRLLGIVEQDIFLFDGTVAENIGYALRQADDDRIRWAAEVANAHEFILDLPHGFDTIVGERGVRLSGGQRQRLAIARAVLADPRILIMDEATSNLDTQSERLIQESLSTLIHGRTTFVIAHRLSTIAHADQIIVLERGRIEEQGTHDELMATSGRYRFMVQMQMGAAIGA